MTRIYTMDTFNMRYSEETDHIIVRQDPALWHIQDWESEYDIAGMCARLSQHVPLQTPISIHTKNTLARAILIEPEFWRMLRSLQPSSLTVETDAEPGTSQDEPRAGEDDLPCPFFTTIKSVSKNCDSFHLRLKLNDGTYHVSWLQRHLVDLACRSFLVTCCPVAAPYFAAQLRQSSLLDFIEKAERIEAPSYLILPSDPYHIGKLPAGLRYLTVTDCGAVSDGVRSLNILAKSFASDMTALEVGFHQESRHNCEDMLSAFVDGLEQNLDVFYYITKDLCCNVEGKDTIRERTYELELELSQNVAANLNVNYNFDPCHRDQCELSATIELSSAIPNMEMSNMDDADIVLDDLRLEEILT